MDKATTFDINYAGLMSHNPDGTYLYIPPTFTNFHPGSVGCFDESGSWNKITDLCKEGQTQADGYTALNSNLSQNELKKLNWKPRSSGSEDSQHAQSEKASLVTGGLVRREKISAPFGKPVAKWADENAKKFLASDFSSHIEKNGLWIIQSTWVANKCAIYMTNSSDKGLDAGLDIAATGGGGDTFEDMKNEGWSTYQAQGDDGGLVVSFSGLHFKPRQFQKFRNDPIKQAQANQYIRGDELIGEIDFESVMVGATSSDAEEEVEGEKNEDGKTKEELGARKTAILRNTGVSDDVVPH